MIGGVPVGLVVMWLDMEGNVLVLSSQLCPSLGTRHVLAEAPMFWLGLGDLRERFVLLVFGGMSER